MTGAPRRALNQAHELVERTREAAATIDGNLGGVLTEIFGELEELLHRAGAGQPTAAEDMRRLAELGHEARARGDGCPLRCVDPKTIDAGDVPVAHEDDCPIVGAMARYPRAQ